MNPSSEPFVPFSRPEIGIEEEQAILEVLRSGWLTTGPQTRAFEQEFSAFAHKRYALAVNSATAGLHLALEALGVGPGDLCAVPVFTFTATAEVVRYQGADPAFIDCAAESPNFDPERLEDLLRRRKVKVVVPVHLTGEPFDEAALGYLQSRYGFSVVEDAAHMIPTRCPDGSLWGSGGQLGVFSFYANKNMTTGEGGMIVTDDENLAKRIRQMRLHGIDRDAFDRFTTKEAQAWAYQVIAPGFKYNMTDLAASLGRVQLKKALDFWLRRQAVVRVYLAELAGLESLKLPLWRDDHAWHVFSVQIVPKKLSIDRDTLVNALTEAGIGISVHYRPLHRMIYWRDRYNLEPQDFPNAELRGETTFSLPLYPSLDSEQIHRVVTTLRELCQRYAVKGD